MSRTTALGVVLIIAVSGAACDRPQVAPVDDVGGAPVAEVGPVAWRVSERGAGPILAGMTIVESERAAATALTLPDATSECIYARVPSGPDGLLFMVVSGRIARVDVTAAGVPTEGGIVVGDSEARVREVYGERVTSTPHKYTDGHYLMVASGAGHRLVFETDGQRVTRYRGGRMPEVEWVEGCS